MVQTKATGDAMTEKSGWQMIPGMTLRDWFAGQALASMRVDGLYSSSNLAASAYKIADAMIARRNVDRTDAAKSEVEA